MLLQRCNTCFWWAYTYVFTFCVYRTVELLRHSVCVCSSLVDVAKQFSRKVLPIYTLTRSMWEFWYSPTLGIFPLFNHRHSGTYGVVSLRGFNLHFLMTNELECLFVFVAIWTACFIKCLFKSSPSLEIGFFILFCRSSLFNMWSPFKSLASLMLFL